MNKTGRYQGMKIVVRLMEEIFLIDKKINDDK